MAKAPEKYKAKEVEPAPEASESPTSVGEVTPVAPPEQKLELKDAARRFVPGFKDHWWPSIEAHAKVMGFVGPDTVEACKTVLRHWGARC